MCELGGGRGLGVGCWVLILGDGFSLGGWSMEARGKGGSCVLEMKGGRGTGRLVSVQVMEEKGPRRLIEIVVYLSLSEICSLSKLSLLAYILNLNARR